MAIFKDQGSPHKFDELGQRHQEDRGTDRNPAWQAQQKTVQQDAKTDGGRGEFNPVPATDSLSNKLNRDNDKWAPVKLAAFGGGALGILYFAMRAMRK